MSIEPLQNEKQIEKLIDFYNPTDKLVLFLFYANWDKNSMSVYTYADILSTKLFEDIYVCGINTDTWKEICKTYNVTSIPTIIVYRNKEKVFTNVGYINYDSLKYLCTSLKLLKSDTLTDYNTSKDLDTVIASIDLYTKYYKQKAKKSK